MLTIVAIEDHRIGEECMTITLNNLKYAYIWNMLTKGNWNGRSAGFWWKEIIVEKVGLIELVGTVLKPLSDEMEPEVKFEI